MPTLANTKKAIWRNLLSVQSEAISLVAMRSKELWLVQENHAPVKLDSSVASRGMETYSKSRAELQNQQILKIMLDVAVNIESWKNTQGQLAIAVKLVAIRFEFWTERSVSDGETLCPLRSVIPKLCSLK